MTDTPANDDESPGAQPAERNRTMSLAEAISLGQSLHRQQRLQEAADIYQQILKLKPGQPEALHFLGLLLHQVGQSEEAERLILAALKTNPNYIDAISNLGNIYQGMERFNEAHELYQRAISLNPDFVNPRLNLATLYYRCGRFEQALAEWQLTMKLSPELAEAHDLVGQDASVQDQTSATSPLTESTAFTIYLFESMANSLMKLGRIDESVGFLHRWQELDPDNPRPRHHIAALTGMSVPPRAPDNYLKTVFDRFANSFDNQLEKLEYSAPTHAMEAVGREIGEATASLAILDAGCGTGWCAAGLRPFARRLTGVDLSGKMLEKARDRKIYDELVETELTEYLLRCPHSFDLIVSTDTLIYFGELHDVMAAAGGALRADGRFIFSVEIATEDDVPNGHRLQYNGRYQHTQAYLIDTMQRAGLKVISLSEFFLRKEGGERVMGCLAVGQRVGSSTAM